MPRWNRSYRTRLVVIAIWLTLGALILGSSNHSLADTSLVNPCQSTISMPTKQLAPTFLPFTAVPGTTLPTATPSPTQRSISNPCTSTPSNPAQPSKTMTAARQQAQAAVVPSGPGSSLPCETAAFAALPGMNYSNFDDISALCLNDDTKQYLDTTAGTNTTILRLTDSQNPTSALEGNAWYGSPQNVGGGFHTDFQFRLTNPVGTYADGLAFVIQNTSSTYPGVNGTVGVQTAGDAGCEIGYGGISNSLAVEIDPFQNNYYCDFIQDPPGPHFSVQTKGQAPNSPSHAIDLNSTDPNVNAMIPPDDQTTPPYSPPLISTNIEDGGWHTMSIDYTPPTDSSLGLLTVSVDGTGKEFHVDLANTLALNNGSAWVGFTASYATYSETTDLLSWNFGVFGEFRGKPYIEG